MRAVVTDPGSPGNVRHDERPAPVPARGEALVRVTAISLNRGELRLAGRGEADRPVGWDVAGVVEQAPSGAERLSEGARVVGFVKASDGWAVVYGVTAEASARLEIPHLMSTGTGRVEGFNLYREVEIEAPWRGLTRLLRLIDGGDLNPHVQVLQDWTDVGRVGQALLEREFSGKAVLEVS